jgi:putative oxidoreductase
MIRAAVRLWETVLPEPRRALLGGVGLLLLRLGVGGFMLFAHGWGKLTSFSEKADKFPDPLGIGSPALSMALAISAEFFCAALLIVGLATRLATIPLMITMLVAALIVHADDPWGKKEFALLYFIPFAALFFTGPGPLSLDALIARRLAKQGE